MSNSTILQLEPITITLDDENYATLRDNPWDERAFGFKVTEILKIQYTDQRIFDRLDEENNNIGAKLCCYRHPADDFLLKKDFIEHGFYLAENALEFYNGLPKLKSKKYFNLEKAAEQHLAQLTDIVTNSFKFSRFHEDPFIDPSKAIIRYQNWIKDLIDSPHCYVASNTEGQAIGFFTFTVAGEEISMNLVGIDQAYRGLGLFFWLTIIDFIRPYGKSCRALASAANMDIINTLIPLGFICRNSFIDYHKRY